VITKVCDYSYSVKMLLYFKGILCVCEFAFVILDKGKDLSEDHLDFFGCNDDYEIQLYLILIEEENIDRIL